MVDHRAGIPRFHATHGRDAGIARPNNRAFMVKKKRAEARF
jgi:hypothetical protein